MKLMIVDINFYSRSKIQINNNIIIIKNKTIN
jgi:hypothetical protein